jgi:hypothetical protein
MIGKYSKAAFSAAGLTASVFGVLAGIGGITHAIGEILQGNVAPSGLIINSWTEGPIAASMGGEPGMTIVPNLLVTGILNLIVSLAVVIWAAAFVQRKYGGWILILLSIGMLLVGGGFAPPIMGILAGVAGLGTGAPLTGWRTRLPENLARFLASLWPWVFTVALINGIFLVIGSVILVYFAGLNNPDLFVSSFFLAVVSLVLMIVTGRAYDARVNRQRVAV